MTRTILCIERGHDGNPVSRLVALDAEGAIDAANAPVDGVPVAA